MQLVIFLTTLVSVTIAQQQQQYTTPIPILKQINRHNEDGSYSYGYEGADGSFKIETKFPNGEVQGKYGYIDDTGNRREIEYGASKRGFEPAGSDINVPPPTLDNHDYPTPNGEDDGQYREDPKIYLDPKYNSKSSVFSKAKPQQYYQNAAPAPEPARPVYQQPQHRFQFQEEPRQQYYQQPQQPLYQPQQPVYQPQKPVYQPQQPAYQPQPQQQQYYQPRPAYKQADLHNIFQGHPAQNIDINTGSYSVSYGR